MRAIVCSRPGKLDVLRLEEMAMPEIGENDLLVRVQVSSVNPIDFFALSRVAYTARWLSARGKPKPEILGADFAGTVEAVGAAVTRFKPGDEVFSAKKWAFAEYLTVASTGPVVAKPKNVSFAHAGTVGVAGLTALQAVRDHAHVEPGDRVLINGASGGVGTFAVQIAKALGAEVTAVCSTQNLQTARAIGAETVIDYTKEDFTRRPGRYDAIIDVAGSHPWRDYREKLKPNASFVLAGASVNTVWRGGATIRHLLGTRLASLRASQRVAFFIAKLNTKDLEYIADLLASGQVKPVIDREYDLSGVPDAMRYMGDGHAKGKLAVRM
jgi:NADPH:quinone reductase-like Zn-dependent oxidoreductase